MNLDQYPVAIKRRPPRNHSWISRKAEYVVTGEPNRFCYISDHGWSINNPGQGSNGERRLVCRVGRGIGLFEEMPHRPRDDNSVVRLH